MKFDLFTKAILSIIAVLLGLNLSFNSTFSLNSVKASSDVVLPNKSYGFFKDKEYIISGKVIQHVGNNWVNVTGYLQNQSVKQSVLVNMDEMTYIVEFEDKSSEVKPK